MLLSLALPSDNWIISKASSENAKRGIFFSANFVKTSMSASITEMWAGLPCALRRTNQPAPRL